MCVCTGVKPSRSDGLVSNKTKDTIRAVAAPAPTSQPQHKSTHLPRPVGVGPFPVQPCRLVVRPLRVPDEVHDLCWGDSCKEVHQRAVCDDQCVGDIHSRLRPYTFSPNNPTQRVRCIPGYATTITHKPPTTFIPYTPSHPPPPPPAPAETSAPLPLAPPPPHAGRTLGPAHLAKTAASGCCLHPHHPHHCHQRERARPPYACSPASAFGA